MFPRKIITVIVLSVFALGAWAQSPTAAQTSEPDKDLGKRKPSRHSGLPVVGEFERQRESDADEARRQTRDKWYAKNVPTRLNAPYGDPGALANGTTESTNTTIIDYMS